MPDESPRSVVVLHPGAELYGADRVLLSVADALTRAWSVRVVLPSGGPLEDELRRRGVEVEHSAGLLVLRKSLLHPRELLLLVPRLLASLLALVRLLRRLQPDVVYVNTVTLPTAVLAGRLVGRRVVCHMHEAEDTLPFLVTAGLTAHLPFAHDVIANSGATATYAARAWRGVRRRTTVVPNGVPPVGVTTPLPESRPTRPQLLLVGRLNPRKGSDVAVDAVALLRDAGVEADLLLAGDVFPGYEWYATQLREQVARLGLEEQVRFLGFVPSPAPLYDAAHFVLVPSQVESFGLVAVEGMSAGRVVVAAPVGGLLDSVLPGVTGELCPPEPRALAEVLQRRLADWEGSRALAARGAEQAERLFGLDAFDRRLLAVLDGGTPSGG